MRNKTIAHYLNILIFIKIDGSHTIKVKLNHVLGQVFWIDFCLIRTFEFLFFHWSTIDNKLYNGQKWLIRTIFENEDTISLPCICRICSSILKEPVQLICGDRYCQLYMNNQNEWILTIFIFFILKICFKNDNSVSSLWRKTIEKRSNLLIYNHYILSKKCR